VERDLEVQSKLRRQNKQERWKSSCQIIHNGSRHCQDVLVDDGIATGATIISAAEWLKTKQNCQELIIAVPVAPRDTINRLEQIAANKDKLIVLYFPEPFIAIGQFYGDFGQVSDGELKKIMKRHGYKIKDG